MGTINPNIANLYPLFLNENLPFGIIAVPVIAMTINEIANVSE